MGKTTNTTWADCAACGGLLPPTGHAVADAADASALKVAEGAKVCIPCQAAVSGFEAEPRFACLKPTGTCHGCGLPVPEPVLVCAECEGHECVSP